MKPAPSYKNPPEYMNPDAQDIWRHAVRRYADDIYESKSLRDQWKKAVSHFTRLCNLRGVQPYNSYHKAAAQLKHLLLRRF